MPKSRHVTIGFQGGQVLSLRVTEEQLATLHCARSATAAGTS